MTDRLQQYLQTLQQIPSCPVWAVSEHEWNNWIISAPSSCWVKDKQPPLCQTIDHKKVMRIHGSTQRLLMVWVQSGGRYSVRQMSWNLPPNNVCVARYREKHFRCRWFRGQGEEIRSQQQAVRVQVKVNFIVNFSVCVNRQRDRNNVSHNTKTNIYKNMHLPIYTQSTDTFIQYICTH